MIHDIVFVVKKNRYFDIVTHDVVQYKYIRTMCISFE